MPALSISSDLLWAAKEIFRYPEPETGLIYKEAVQKMFVWAGSKGFQTDPLNYANINWDQLQVDFTALFINGFPAVKAQPYAGWYLGDPSLFSTTDYKMREFYSSYGVSYDQNQSLPADHVMVELEFLAITAEQYEITGDQTFYAAMQDMLNQYMVNWIFEFLQKIKSNARTSLYQNMALILELLFNELRTELKEVA